MKRRETLERLMLGLFTCLFTYGFIFSNLAFSQNAVQEVPSSAQSEKSITATDLGVSFVKDSTSQIIVERDGKKYAIDLATHEIREAVTEPGNATPAVSHVSTSDPQSPHPGTAPAEKKKKVYRPGDDFVFSVPTGRPLDHHGLYIDFTHRFPYEAAFTGTARGGTLLGFDDFAIPSFGLRYGLTSKISVMAMRSPSIIGRPIELMAAYNFLDEHNGNPLNAVVRFSIDGQNDFEKNFAENFELIVSRSFGHRAQIYAAPTVTLNARPLLGANSIVNAPIDLRCRVTVSPAVGPILVLGCSNIFSLGTALAVDIRPTVALIAEATPTLANGLRFGDPSSVLRFWHTEKDLEAWFHSRIH